MTPARPAELQQAPQERQVVIFAKEPVPGRVKTRLVPPLTAEEAAACHAAFVEDTAKRLSVALSPGRSAFSASVALAVDPFSACPSLRALAGRYDLDLIDQGPGDLGQRMERVLGQICREGHHGVLVGADTPDLPTAYIESAFAHVQKGDVSLGPSRDGGYYLVGAAGAVPDIFRLDAAWGSDAVLSETRSRLGSRLPPPSFGGRR
jgi:rSAM/selenodomain-associated transferase 1